MTKRSKKIERIKMDTFYAGTCASCKKESDNLLRVTGVYYINEQKHVFEAYICKDCFPLERPLYTIAVEPFVIQDEGELAEIVWLGEKDAIEQRKM